MPSYVIAGGGLAAAKAAETLRDEGFDGEIVLIGSEPERPYERPPLSKGYLLGNDSRDSVYVHPADWYAEHGVDLQRGRHGHRDRPRRAPSSPPPVPRRAEMSYDKLLLATGASPRRLDFPGSDREEVLYLRTLGDSDRLRSAFQPGTRVVVAGAGWIGLETTAAARTAECTGDRARAAAGALHDQLGPELGAVFADLHRAHGVEFRFGERAVEFRPGMVITSGGAEVPADILIVGIGAAPNDGLAARAGLETGNGVLTDEALRTSDPNIFAAGDVANSFNPLLGRRVRVEHWANALNGGPAAARSMLGQPVRTTGCLTSTATSTSSAWNARACPPGPLQPGPLPRRPGRTREFIAFWLSGGAVIAGMNVNVWDVNDDIQSLIRSARPVDPTRLTNPNIPLTDL